MSTLLIMSSTPSWAESKKEDCSRVRDPQRHAAADHGLALLIGQIFSGALITEIVFSYPGLGSLLYNAIVNGDYNLIMGITVFSIVAITTAILIIRFIVSLLRPQN